MYRKAIELSGHRLRKYQYTPETYKSLAEVISTNESRYQESLKVIDTLLSIAPDLPVAHLERARYLLKLNRVDEADQTLQGVLYLRSSKATALHEMGQVYLDENHVEKAAQCFQEGLKHQPTNGYLKLELGCLIASNRTGGLDEMIVAIGQ